MFSVPGAAIRLRWLNGNAQGSKTCSTGPCSDDCLVSVTQYPTPVQTDDSPPSLCVFVRFNELRSNSEFPYDKVPVIDVDGRRIPQSGAITRYVAKLAGVYPEDPVECAFSDSIFETAQELCTINPMINCYAGRYPSGHRLRTGRDGLKKEGSRTRAHGIAAWGAFEGVQKILREGGGTGLHTRGDCRPARPSLCGTGPKSWLSASKAERTGTAPMDHTVVLASGGCRHSASVCVRGGGGGGCPGEVVCARGFGPRWQGWSA